MLSLLTASGQTQTETGTLVLSDIHKQPHPHQPMRKLLPLKRKT